jgi:hypothetical protein
MAEDCIPEILAEQRLGHEVPGMRGLYAHASDRMRAELRATLQERWEDSLRARAALHPHSPVPLLDRLLATHCHEQAGAATQDGTLRHPSNVIHIERQGEGDLPHSSQPRRRPHPARVG